MTAPDTSEIEDAFLLQLGRTLAKWQWVEQASYDLYVHMMKGADKHLISVTWHHIQSFDTRLGLLNSCAHFAVREDFRPDWKNLRGRLEKASKTRNSIVHSVFGVRVDDGIGAAYLTTSHFDSTAIVRGKVNKNELRPEFIFDLARLARHMGEFEALSRKVLWFRALAFGLSHSEKNGAHKRP